MSRPSSSKGSSSKGSSSKGKERYIEPEGKFVDQRWSAAERAMDDPYFGYEDERPVQVSHTDKETLSKMFFDANRSLNTYAKQVKESNARHAAELKTLRDNHQAWTKELTETQNIRYAEIERRLGSAQARAQHFEQANRALEARVKDLEQRVKSEQQHVAGLRNSTTEQLRTMHTYAQRVKDMLHEATNQFSAQLQGNRQFVEARRRYDEFMGRHGTFVRSFGRS